MVPAVVIALLLKAFYAGESVSIPDYDALPEREVVRSDYSDVFEDANWWTSGDDSGANTFLTVPYFPFLSSCAGYGNYMSFAKLVESHPDCTVVSCACRTEPGPRIISA